MNQDNTPASHTTPSPTESPLMPLVRCASFRGYRSLVSELGGDADQFLTEAGVAGVDIDNEETRIPTRCLCDALEIASRTLNVDDFGLQLSLRQDLDILGPIALLLQNAHSLSDIIDIMTRHMQTVHNQSERVHLSVKHNQLFVQHIHTIPHVIDDVQITLLGFGFAARMAQQRLAPKLIPKAIYFTHPEPKDSRLYRDIFNTAVYFNQTFAGSVIDLSTLQKKHTLTQVNVRHAESLIFQQPRYRPNPISLSQQLRILLTQTLSSSDKGLAYYAKQLQMSERTLQRKLRAESQSFSSIVDQLRKDMAKQYIDNHCFNMAQITDMLGFSDPAVFTRAFTRWYGITPTGYAGLAQR